MGGLSRRQSSHFTGAWDICGTVRAADDDGVNRRAGARVFSPVERRKPQVKNRFCHP